MSARPARKVGSRGRRSNDRRGCVARVSRRTRPASGRDGGRRGRRHVVHRAGHDDEQTVSTYDLALGALRGPPSDLLAVHDEARRRPGRWPTPRPCAAGAPRAAPPAPVRAAARVSAPSRSTSTRSSGTPGGGSACVARTTPCSSTTSTPPAAEGDRGHRDPLGDDDLQGARPAPLHGDVEHERQGGDLVVRRADVDRGQRPAERGLRRHGLDLGRVDPGGAGDHDAAGVEPPRVPGPPARPGPAGRRTSSSTSAPSRRARRVVRADPGDGVLQPGHAHRALPARRVGPAGS